MQQYGTTRQVTIDRKPAEETKFCINAQLSVASRHAM